MPDSPEKKKSYNHLKISTQKDSNKDSQSSPSSAGMWSNTSTSSECCPDTPTSSECCPDNSESRDSCPSAGSVALGIICNIL